MKRRHGSNSYKKIPKKIRKDLIKNPPREPTVLPIPTRCDNCGSEDIAFVNNEMVFGAPKGAWPWVWHCYTCEARVACVKYEKYPLGTMASRSLRSNRVRVHEGFDKLWKSGLMTRDNAYRWLSDFTGLPPSKCHIGLFTPKICNQVIKELKSMGLYDSSRDTDNE